MIFLKVNLAPHAHDPNGLEGRGKKWIKIAVEFCVQSEHLPPTDKTHVLIQSLHTRGF